MLGGPHHSIYSRKKAVVAALAKNNIITPEAIQSDKKVIRTLRITIIIIIRITISIGHADFN